MIRILVLLVLGLLLPLQVIRVGSQLEPAGEPLSPWGSLQTVILISGILDYFFITLRAVLCRFRSISWRAQSVPPALATLFIRPFFSRK